VLGGAASIRDAALPQQGLFVDGQCSIENVAQMMEFQNTMNRNNSAYLPLHSS